MSVEILINVTPKEVRIALLENCVLQEVFIERIRKNVLVGNIYKGKVTRILPGIQAAFVDIGIEKAGFLHRNDISNNETIDIRELVKVGQEMLVQVYKEPLGSKGPRLTAQLTLPARYLVFTPGQSQVIVSQKISNSDERLRLQALTSSGDEGGYIIRTAAVGVSENEIDTDKKFLRDLWQEIQTRAETAKVGSIIYEEIPPVLRILRDLAVYQVSRIRVDNEKTHQEMREFAKNYIPNLTDLIEYYQEARP